MSTALDLPDSGYPIRFDVAYPDELSRWLIFVKWLLAIPHYIILYFLQILFSVVTLVAFFAILFTKTYPRDLFRFAVGTRRWQNNVNAYTSLMRDEYPPFSWDPGTYAAVYDADYPVELNRWLPLIKWLLAIPHYIVLALLGIVWLFVLIGAWFAILLTRRYPRPLFDFGVGMLRWSERVTMYVYLATDAYPPFSLKP
jgi:hypothetical protein